MNSEPLRRHPVLRPRLVALTSVLLIVGAAAIVLNYIDNSEIPRESGLNISNDPLAKDVVPRYFGLWELHPDDSVRLVILIDRSNATGKRVNIEGPSLRPGDDVLSVSPIGGELVDENVYEYEYRGKTYQRPVYTLLASRNRYGCEIIVNHPPHLHTNRPDRLISIGWDSGSYYSQKIDSVAIPSTANISTVYSYQPYRHITISGWDVFYYDITDIERHISIHITYDPEGDAPALDWMEVEAAR